MGSARCRDLITAHITDLGGVDNCSAAERSIVRRGSVLTVELERMERQFALDEQASAADLDAYQRVANSLRRLLEAVGLERRAKPVPTLAEYLAQKYPPEEAGTVDAAATVEAAQP
jgi:hypothetical protein